MEYLNLTGLQTFWDKIKLAIKAVLNNAQLTGTPTAPTVSSSDNSTSIATTAMVQNAITAKIGELTNAMVFKGSIGSAGTVTTLPTVHEQGWVYMVQEAGTYASNVCEIGDMIICLKSVTDAANAADSDWTVIQTNINGAVIRDGDLTTNQVVLGSNGTNSLKTIPAGTEGQTLTITGGKAVWKTPSSDTDTDTTYTFKSGTAGDFTVTPLNGSTQTVSIGKPATAGTADKVANALSITIGEETQTYDGSQSGIVIHLTAITDTEINSLN